MKKPDRSYYATLDWDDLVERATYGTATNTDWQELAYALAQALREAVKGEEA